MYADHYVASVGAYIFDSQERLILQKRAHHKSMWGKLHTSVAGHINSFETVDFALSKECLEEIGYPATIVPEDMDWAVWYQSLHPFLSQTICCKKIAQYDIQFFSVSQNIQHAFYTTDYIGTLTWSPKNHDGSVAEFITKELEDIEQWILENPDDFTAGFPHYFKKNRDRLYEFRDMLRLKLNE